MIYENVAEREAAEKALRESQELLHTVLNSIDAAVYVADMDSYEILFANEFMKRIFGDITGQTCWKVIQKDQAGPCSFCTNSRLLTPGGEPAGAVTWEFYNPVAGDWIECHDRAIRWLDGRIVRIEIATDITARKRAEDALQKTHDELERRVLERTAELQSAYNTLAENERLYRNLFENASIGMFQTPLDGSRSPLINRAFAAMLGYESPEEVLSVITDTGTQIHPDPQTRRRTLGALEHGDWCYAEEPYLRKDGSIMTGKLSVRMVRNPDGPPAYLEGIVEDITEKKLAFDQTMLQRDLALKLAQIDKLEEGLAVILETAIVASGMECAGLLLKSDESGGFHLAHSLGLTQRFQDKMRYLPRTQLESFIRSHIAEKKSFHTRTNSKLTPKAFEEGFRIVSIMPVSATDGVIGYLVMASKVLFHIPEQVRTGLELLAAQSGNSIARMQARESLEAEILVRKEAENELTMKSLKLEEVNTALKVLLAQREQDKNELEDKILFNVRKLILPYVEALKQRHFDDEHRTYLDVLETNLKNIISPFARKLSSVYENFTPQELKIADLIREGKTVKEIATAFGVSETTINFHRQHIRNKLGLNKQKVNLKTYLMSLVQ